MMNMICKLIDRLCAAMGAVAFMQAPQFIQDYTHVLYGHIAELNWQLEHMRTELAHNSKSLLELVHKFLSHSDRDIIMQGEFIEKLLQREQAFTKALEALQTTGPLMKPFVFLRYSDGEIMRETWVHFKLGLPVTGEALIWGFIGLLVGFALFAGLSRLLHALSRSTRSWFSR